MSLEKVEGFSSLRKDTSNGGVVNVDRGSYDAFMKQKMLQKKKKEMEVLTHSRVDSLEKEINTIREDLQDIRSLLVQILQKGN